MIRFTDHADSFSVRQQFMQAHLQWLAENQQQVKLAGSLRSDAGGKPEGALWIVEARTEEEAQAIFLTDPFWLNGMRKHVEIKSWSLAFDTTPAELSQLIHQPGEVK